VCKLRLYILTGENGGYSALTGYVKASRDRR